MPDFCRITIKHQIAGRGLNCFYVADDLDTGKEVVVKRFDLEAVDPAKTSAITRAFVQRAKFQKQVAKGSPYWVKVFGTESNNRFVQYIAEKFEGSLESLIDDPTTIGPEALYNITRSVVKGLIDLHHRHHRPHGNLKLGNVLIESLSEADCTRVAITDLSHSLALPQDVHKSDCDDLRDFGRLIYRLVTKHAPETPVESYQHHAWSLLGPTSSGWQQLCHKLIHASPARPPTLESVLEQIESLRVTKRHFKPLKVILPLLAIAVITAGAIFAWKYYPRSDNYDLAGKLIYVYKADRVLKELCVESKAIKDDFSSLYELLNEQSIPDIRDLHPDIENGDYFDIPTYIDEMNIADTDDIIDPDTARRYMDELQEDGHTLILDYFSSRDHVDQTDKSFTAYRQHLEKLKGCLVEIRNNGFLPFKAEALKPVNQYVITKFDSMRSALDKVYMEQSDSILADIIKSLPKLKNNIDGIKMVYDDYSNKSKKYLKDSDGDPLLQNVQAFMDDCLSKAKNSEVVEYITGKLGKAGEISVSIENIELRWGKWSRWDSATKKAFQESFYKNRPDLELPSKHNYIYWSQQVNNFIAPVPNNMYIVHADDLDKLQGDFNKIYNKLHDNFRDVKSISAITDILQERNSQLTNSIILNQSVDDPASFTHVNEQYQKDMEAYKQLCDEACILYNKQTAEAKNSISLTNLRESVDSKLTLLNDDIIKLKEEADRKHFQEERDRILNDIKDVPDYIYDGSTLTWNRIKDMPNNVGHETIIRSGTDTVHTDITQLSTKVIARLESQFDELNPHTRFKNKLENLRTEAKELEPDDYEQITKQFNDLDSQIEWFSENWVTNNREIAFIKRDEVASALDNLSNDIESRLPLRTTWNQINILLNTHNIEGVESKAIIAAWNNKRDAIADPVKGLDWVMVKKKYENQYTDLKNILMEISALKENLNLLEHKFSTISLTSATIPAPLTRDTLNTHFNEYRDDMLSKALALYLSNHKLANDNNSKLSEVVSSYDTTKTNLLKTLKNITEAQNRFDQYYLPKEKYVDGSESKSTLAELYADIIKQPVYKNPFFTKLLAKSVDKIGQLIKPSAWYSRSQLIEIEPSEYDVRHFVAWLNLDNTDTYTYADLEFDNKFQDNISARIQSISNADRKKRFYSIIADKVRKRWWTAYRNVNDETKRKNLLEIYFKNYFFTPDESDISKEMIDSIRNHMNDLAFDKFAQIIEWYPESRASDLREFNLDNKFRLRYNYYHFENAILDSKNEQEAETRRQYYREIFDHLSTDTESEMIKKLSGMLASKLGEIKVDGTSKAASEIINGWTREPHASNPNIMFMKKDDHIITFIRVGADGGGSTYISSSEISVELFKAIFDSANTGSQHKVKQYMAKPEPDPSDYSAMNELTGPRAWDWKGKTKGEIITGLKSWYRYNSTYFETNNSPSYLKQYTRIETPSAKHPMQYVSPQAAIEVAGLLQCRLPTVIEWRAALNSTDNPNKSPGNSTNLRDMAWKSAYDKFEQIGRNRDTAILNNREALMLGSYVKSPSSGIAMDSNTEKGASGNYAFNDGTILFKKTDPGSTKFQDLIGNVAEYVYTVEPKTPDIQSNSDNIAIIGGSAMTPKIHFNGKPIYDAAVPPSKDVATDTVGYSDVGFRLAFKMQATSILEQLRILINGKDGDHPYRKAIFPE